MQHSVGQCANELERLEWRRMDVFGEKAREFKLKRLKVTSVKLVWSVWTILGDDGGEYHRTLEWNA